MFPKLLMQSIRSVFVSRPDISKASELVLCLDVYQERDRSDSPEFFVQEVIPFRVSHPRNKKVSMSYGYEFVGYIIRRPGGGLPAVKSRAHIICWKEAWRLLQGNKSFTVVVCESPKKRMFATASRRGDCVTFDALSLVKHDVREGKSPCAS